MPYPSEIEAIDDTLEKEVAHLFHDLGFNFIKSNHDVILRSEKIGEVDLLFTFEQFLFLIEVTKEKDNRTKKKITFFSKWSKEAFLKPIRENFDLSTKKIVSLYFDFSKNSHKDESDSVISFLEDQKLTSIAYRDDFEYFQNSVKKIGKWARNDFLDWVGVSDKKKMENVDAIQYYIQEFPVYSFVQRVDTLLNSCYISRRRRNSPDPGYQRTLNERRISKIQRSIENHSGLAFPNSILIYSPKLTDELYSKQDCPKHVTIRFPTNFCSCRVIDGQHRLLSFSKLDPEKLESYFLTVIALPEIESKKEFTTFIDINSKQQKMDNNLILHLKSDFDWPSNSKEQLEQIGVKVAEKLNEQVLKNRIYFGTADETKGNKITLVTFVPALRANKQILANEDETYKKISKIFALIGEHMPHLLKPSGLFNQNQGIRILFRLVHLFERNQSKGKVHVSQNEFFADLNKILDENLIHELLEHYGGGGATNATKLIIEQMKKRDSIKYGNMQMTLYGI